MGVIAKGILRGCQGLFTPVSLRYSLSVFNKNSTLKRKRIEISLVFVTIMLHVLTYVLSNKLFWN